MKKKLLFMSFAALFCGLFAFAQKPVNVADKYMANYTDPYYYVDKLDANGDTVGEFLDNHQVMKFEPTVKITQGAGAEQFEVTVPRYHVIDEPWKTEGMLGTLGTDATGWHVDLQKGKRGRIKGTLTLTTGWGDFAAEFENMKVYQTTKAAVPAGKYDLVANWGQDRTGAKYTFLVLTKGTAIPDTIDLVNNTDANVLGYANLGDTLTVPFELTEPTVLTFGFVASFPAHENPDQGYSVAMGDFELTRWVDGTNYRPLQAEYRKVEKITTTNYPTGTGAGQYQESAWNDFVKARDAVKAIIDNIPEGNPIDNPGYKDNATQAEVDAAIEAMVMAYEKLQTAMNLPFKYSTDAKSYYYRLSDLRKPANYWNMSNDFLEDGVTAVDRLMITQELDEAAESMMFKFVEATADGKEGFYIYNKALGNALSVLPGNLIVSQAEGVDTTWVLKRSTAPNAKERFVISIEGVDRQLNSYANAGIVGFWNQLNDIGNAWKFERVYMEGETNFAALSKAVAEAKNMTAERYPIGTGLAQFNQAAWDAFVVARDKAIETLGKEDATPQPTQADVDAAVQTLKDAVAALDASMTDPIYFSTDTEEHYYIVHDKRATKYYWVIEDADVNGTPVPRLKISQTADNESDMYKFKFVKKAADSKEFYIYSKTNAELALSISPDDKNFIQLNGVSENEAWTLGRTPAKDPDYFTIARATPTPVEKEGEEPTEKFEQLNSYANAGHIGFWTPTTDDPGNDWKFITEVESGINNLTIVDLGLLVRDRKIVSTDANAVINVYNINGQKLNSKYELATGIYIVTVEGKIGAAKVIVK